jgi:predicted transcriptional regulator
MGTLTIRLDEELDQHLARLAKGRQKSPGPIIPLA